MDKEKYQQLQEEMAQKVNIPSSGSHFKMKKYQLIFTFDIQYLGDLGFVAVDVMSYEGELKGIFTYKYDVTVEYQPGYFAFREGPLLKQSLEDLIKTEGLEPSLLLIDGHGTAHPRKLGVASWLGVQTGIPSIGVAKRALLKTDYTEILGKEAGEIVEVKLEEEIVGFVLRSQTDVKPIFVSAGHEISQEEALRIAKKLRGEFRILEPVRRADRAARDAAKLDIRR
ncbi:MAG: deoxyribonuclease V [Maribacter sp.]|jgi:deoxyribonuclease V